MVRPCVYFAASIAATFACSADSTNPPPPPLPVATVDVTPTQASVAVAGAVQLSAVAKDSLGAVVSSAVIVWSSASSGVASVGLAGQVSGLAPGQTWVRATANGVSDSASVTVSAGLTGSVSVSPQADSVATGSVVELRAVVRDLSGALIPGATVTWSSGNTAVATVTSGGFVTGTGAGTAGITATHGTTSGTAQVTVKNGLLRNDTAKLPLIDLGGTYRGFSGSLYSGGNMSSASHTAAGAALARSITPLDVNGQPDPSGSYVLLSNGMSSATQEWCTEFFADPCNSWSFVGQATSHPLVRKSRLRIVNGAEGGQYAALWVNPTDANYDRVRDSALAPAGLSEKQVQAIWFKHATGGPTDSLPRASADAFLFERDLGRMLRAAKVRYPNLRLVFVTSRIYGGYTSSRLNPEPYAYEEGFSVKWLVEAQERQMAAGGTLVDPTAGDLNYADGTAPWVDWGPYLWANGTIPRSDGLVWPRNEFEPDGLHPSDAGEAKVAGFLLTHFLTAPTTRCWFATTGSCP